MRFMDFKPSKYYVLAKSKNENVTFEKAFDFGHQSASGLFLGLSKL